MNAALGCRTSEVALALLAQAAGWKQATGILAAICHRLGAVERRLGGYMHGGPRTPEGLEASRRARLMHGWRSSADARTARDESAARRELWGEPLTLSRGRPAATWTRTPGENRRVHEVVGRHATSDSRPTLRLMN